MVVLTYRPTLTVGFLIGPPKFLLKFLRVKGETFLGERKPRIRKAPTLREQADAARLKTQMSEEVSVRRIRLPKWSIFSVVGRVLGIILRPLRWLAPRYLKNAWQELKQVTWPTRRETWRLTLAVFIFAIIFGLLIAGVDWILDQIFKKVILKQ